MDDEKCEKSVCSNDKRCQRPEISFVKQQLEQELKHGQQLRSKSEFSDAGRVVACAHGCPNFPLKGICGETKGQNYNIYS